MRKEGMNGCNGSLGWKFIKVSFLFWFGTVSEVYGLLSVLMWDEFQLGIDSSR